MNIGLALQIVALSMLLVSSTALSVTRVKAAIRSLNERDTCALWRNEADYR